MKCAPSNARRSVLSRQSWKCLAYSTTILDDFPLYPGKRIDLVAFFDRVKQRANSFSGTGDFRLMLECR